RQNNDSLAALSQKVSQLRDVTMDIYDRASDHSLIESTGETFSSAGAGVRSSMRKLGIMARRGEPVAIFKLAAGLVISVLLLWWMFKKLW
ncbi:hypothetical protein K470DRAFT_220804, partial [Piedraia hortae CBS 480.64]